MPDLRYFEKEKRKATVPAIVPRESEFLRTGRINRNRPNWEPVEKRYMSYEEVAERTGKYLMAVGDKTHERINGFHKSIQFPKAVFHRTLKGTPHLGYCHVTGAKTSFAQFKDVRWSFYIANFYADIADDLSFDKINMRAQRMYFAVALDKDQDRKAVALDKKIRGNGLLFQTDDPKAAMKNVLMMGTKSETVRRIIRAL